jgi:hypothetical protein
MEFNVGKQIKSYWNKFIGLTDANNEEFADATSENSVRASKFLEGLNLDPIMLEINKYYAVIEGVETYPRRAMVKTFIWRNINTIKYYTKEARHLGTHPDEALELGFNIDQDGKVIVPDHETLRHFEKVRIGTKGMDAIMQLFCIKVVDAGNKLGLKIGKYTGTDSTPIKTHNDPDGKYNGHYKKEMVKAQITMDYEHNIPLAKKICGGTENDDAYLENMLRMAAVSAKMNMEETWFDGGYNSNRNIAFAHVEMGLMSHYHINKDWNENVKYEHRFNGKTYFYSPEQEINYLYRKNWQDPKYKKDGSLEYKMQFLVKKGFHDPVAMYFRNDYMNKYDECPDNVLDLYHRRNSNEGINSYLKDHLEVEVHLNGKGMKNIDLHVTECCIVMLAVAFARLQHGIKENLSSVAYLT